MENKVIVLDEGYIKHKGIFAYMNNPNIPVTYLFMRMCIGYLKKIRFGAEDIIIMAQDFGNWRKEIDPEYKRQRKDAREERKPSEWWKHIYDEFNEFYKILDLALPWQFCKAWKTEADDWASAVCRYYTNKEIILVSSDRDWEQLCNFPNVKIFSPLTKKYKIVKDPMKVLVEKIHGDVSDNLLTVPSSEMEFDKRKRIVDLINPLPSYIEQPIIEKFKSFLPKNLYVHKIPYRSIAEDIKKLYNFT